MDKALVDQVLAQSCSPRLGEPQDAAALVAYLLSDDASYISGQIVGVNGGMSFRG